MTGYRAFSRTFVKTFPVLSKGFEIETEMTIHALDKNLSLASIPVGYRDRPQGSESKLNTVSDGCRVLKTIVRLFKDYKPLLFFGLLLADCLCGGFDSVHSCFHRIRPDGIGSPTAYAGYGRIYGRGGAAPAGRGLILDTQGKTSRQQYELQMNAMQMLYDLGRQERQGEAEGKKAS